MQLKREVLSPIFLLSYTIKNYRPPKLKIFCTASGPVCIEVINALNTIRDAGLCNITTTSCGSYIVIPERAILNKKHIDNNYLKPIAKAQKWIRENVDRIWMLNILAHYDLTKSQILDKGKEIFVKVDVKTSKELEYIIGNVERAIGHNIFI